MSMSTIKRLTAAFLLVTVIGYGNEQAVSSQDYPSLASFQSQSQKWDIFADVLVWSAQETCSEWAFVVAPPFANPPAAPISGSYDAVLKAVTFDWNAGVRTGISYTFERDRWDTRLYYTWHRTNGSRHINPPPGEVIQSQFISTDFLLTLPGLSIAFDRAKINWDILFNMFNWDLGRIFYLGQSLSLRPHIGLQSGWIHQNVLSHWYHSNTLVPYDAREKIRHHFWGIGPEVGINSKWNFWKNARHALSIFGDFGQAFMWGHWSVHEEADTTIKVTTINTQPDRNMGSLTFQGAAGFVWDARLNKNGSLFTFKLGYEFQIWTQQLQFFQHFSGILNNALILQGVTGRFLVEF
ncbi:MAG: hypothetical protein JSR93_07775 [Verrucomicrobia bacterium]|nr:hypothetical protein [Verrucomicrobiota bacterium]